MHCQVGTTACLHKPRLTKIRNKCSAWHVMKMLNLTYKNPLKTEEIVKSMKWKKVSIRYTLNHEIKIEH